MKFILGVASILLASLLLLVLVAMLGKVTGGAQNETDWLKQTIAFVLTPEGWVSLAISLLLIVLGVRMIVPKKWTPIVEPEHFLSKDSKKLF